MAFGRDESTEVTTDWKNPRQVIQAELGRDEKLIWADAPISLKSHAYSSIPLALFGIPFFAFSVFWTKMAVSMGGGQGLGGFDMIFPMFGIPFMLVGLGMLLSPLWKMYKAKRITYALTDKRMIIRQAFPRIEIQSWSLSGIKNLSRNGPAKGPGDVIFAEIQKTGNKGRQYTEKVGFIGISEPKRLEDKIRSII